MTRAPLSVTRPRDGGAGNRSLSLRFRALRAESVLTAPGTAVLLGMTCLGALGVSIAERNGLLAPGAWPWIGGIGLVLLSLKVALDFADRSDDAALWRQLLEERFVPKGEADAEITRLTEHVIDLRCRLAEAEARSTDSGRAMVSDMLPALDTWIEGIARLAGRLGELRSEVRFQTGLAETSSRRLAQIQSQEKTARDPHLLRQLSETANSLRHQIDAADRFRSFAESGFLQFEHAVAALGTVGSQLMLVMSRGEDIGGPEALGAQIGQEVASLEGLLQALDRVAGSVPAPPLQPEVSRPGPAPELPGLPFSNVPLPDPPAPDEEGSGFDTEAKPGSRWLQ